MWLPPNTILKILVSKASLDFVLTDYISLQLNHRHSVTLFVGLFNLIGLGYIRQRESNSGMIIYPERSFCSLLRSRPQPGLTGDIHCSLNERNVESSVTPLVRMDRATVLVVLVLALVLALVINLMFTMYHLYLRSNSNYQHRLLNILFCHLAATLQFGSLINILNIVRSLGPDLSSTYVNYEKNILKGCGGSLHMYINIDDIFLQCLQNSNSSITF